MEHKVTKTLAEFKRDIHTGMEIVYERNEERAWSDEEHTNVGEYYPTPLPERMRNARYVSHVDTTGFYMKQPEDKSKRGSFCEWPKSADLVYVGDTFTITDRNGKGEPYQKRYYRITIH